MVQRKRARLNLVAELAGVGIATVDRVLNERGNVSAGTARKVIEAARQLGIDRTLPSPHRRLFRVRVIMPARRTALLDRLGWAFKGQIALTNKTLVIERILFEERHADSVPDLIRAGTADSVIVFGPETSAMIEAIAAATAAGVPVVTLGSDLPTTPRLTYVGIDHYGAGRAAAFFMSRMARPGTLVAVCSNLKYRAEAQRISGFRDGMRTETSAPCTLEVLEGDDWTGGQIRGDIAGIYVVGSQTGLARAMAAWLAQKPIVIAHDLGDDFVQLLREGAITLAIDQNPEEQAARSIAVLLARFGLAAAAPETGWVPFTLHTRHNLPKVR